MLFQWRANVEDCGWTLQQLWLNATCLRNVYNRPVDRLVLGQRRDDWPALNQQNQTVIWWVGIQPLYEVHRRQVLNECWPAPEMVVEGIHFEDIFELVSVALSLILSWIFRILAHEGEQCTDFLSRALKQTKAGRRVRSGTPFLVFIENIKELCEAQTV